MDLLARCRGRRREILDEIAGKGASIVFVKKQHNYSRDTEDPIGWLMLNVVGRSQGSSGP